MAIKHKIGIKGGTETVMLTPMKAIRRKCMDCVCWQYSEIDKCEVELCPLWPFRSGKTGKKRPGTGGTGEALKKWRKKQAEAMR